MSKKRNAISAALAAVQSAPSPSAGPETNSATRRAGEGYFTRSKINDYKAAGVLPVTLHNNRTYVLLGAEFSRCGRGHVALLCECALCSLLLSLSCCAWYATLIFDVHA